MSKAQQENQRKEDAKTAQQQLEDKFAFGIPMNLPDYALNPDLAAFLKKTVVYKFEGVGKKTVDEDVEIEALRHADENMDLDFGGGFDDVAVSGGGSIGRGVANLRISNKSATLRCVIERAMEVNLIRR